MTLVIKFNATMWWWHKTYLFIYFLFFLVFSNNLVLRVKAPLLDSTEIRWNWLWIKKWEIQNKIISSSWFWEWWRYYWTQMKYDETDHGSRNEKIFKTRLFLVQFSNLLDSIWGVNHLSEKLWFLNSLGVRKKLWLMWWRKYPNILNDRFRYWKWEWNKFNFFQDLELFQM